jgi:hypothetical protein
MRWFTLAARSGPFVLALPVASIALVALVALVACGGARRPAAPLEAAATPADAGPAPDGADPDAVAATDAGGIASSDAWRVALTAKGATSVESWPALAHEWRVGSPAGLVADRELCLPSGRYVFEEISSPSLDLDLTVDGNRVLTQRDFPTEISQPVAIDGCVKVHAELRNPLGFPAISFRVRVRPAAPALPPCEASFPKGTWNACRYVGRNQEELIARETWTKLAVPSDEKEGVDGQFDWRSVVARTTACFPKGAYVFHSTSDDTLRVYVGDAVVIDAPSTRRFPVMESKPTPLEGCLPIRVVHSYRFGDSTLELAWATVGSAQDRAWSVERACGFECPEQSRCTDGNNLAPEVKATHLCVPFGRKSHLMEYCDQAHPCSAAYCIRARCLDD